MPSLAVTWRRFHDIGKSGAICLLGYGLGIGSIVFVAVMAVTYSFSGSYASSQSALASMGLFILLLFLALVVVAILMLVWLCRAGQAGANRFGPDPKAPVGYSRDFDDFQDDDEDAPWHY